MGNLDKAITKILSECPEKISTPDLAVLIANIVNVYGFEHLWPIVALQTTELLDENESRNEALEDADDFLDKITKGHTNGRRKTD